MSELAIQELSAELRDAIQSLRSSKGLEEAGKVTAFALNLLEDEIGAVIMGDDSQVVAGAKVTMTGHVLDVPVGPELIGRVVNPLGEPLDGKGPIKAKQKGLLERAAPGVMARKSVHEP